MCVAIYRHVGEFGANIEGLKSDEGQGISIRGVRQFGSEHNGWQVHISWHNVVMNFLWLFIGTLEYMK